MSGCTYPDSRLEKLSLLMSARKSLVTWLEIGSAMLKYVGWVATVAVLVFLVWQVAVADPLWPRMISALFLSVLSLLAGLRLGADSAAAYTRDLHRLNNVIVDQNQELRDSNLVLLKQLHMESESPTDLD